MICMNCDNDLVKCWCDDMPERLEILKNCGLVAFGQDYLERLEARAELILKQRKEQRSLTE